MTSLSRLNERLLSAGKSIESVGNELRRRPLAPRGEASLEAMPAALAAVLAILLIWLSRSVEGADPRR